MLSEWSGLDVFVNPVFTFFFLSAAILLMSCWEFLAALLCVSFCCMWVIILSSNSRRTALSFSSCRLCSFTSAWWMLFSLKKQRRKEWRGEESLEQCVNNYWGKRKLVPTVTFVSLVREDSTSLSVRRLVLYWACRASCCAFFWLISFLEVAISIWKQFRCAVCVSFFSCSSVIDFL